MVTGIYWGLIDNVGLSKLKTPDVIRSLLVARGQGWNCKTIKNININVLVIWMFFGLLLVLHTLRYRKHSPVNILFQDICFYLLFSTFFSFWNMKLFFWQIYYNFNLLFEMLLDLHTGRSLSLLSSLCHMSCDVTPCSSSAFLLFSEFLYFIPCTFYKNIFFLHHNLDQGYFITNLKLKFHYQILKPGTMDQKFSAVYSKHVFFLL